MCNFSKNSKEYGYILKSILILKWGGGGGGGGRVMQYLSLVQKPFLNIFVLR